MHYIQSEWKTAILAMFSYIHINKHERQRYKTSCGHQIVVKITNNNNRPMNQSIVCKQITRISGLIPSIDLWKRQSPHQLLRRP